MWAGGKPTSVIPLRKQHAVLVISGISSAELSLPAYLPVLYSVAMEVLATQQANTSRRTPSAGDHQHGLLLRCAGSTTRKETAAVRILSTQVSQGTAYVKEMSPQQGAPSMQAYCRSACLPHKQSHHLQSPKQSCVGAICLLQQSCRTTSTNHVTALGQILQLPKLSRYLLWWCSLPCAMQSMSCRVTCGPMQPFTCKQKCMELGIDPTDALELPTPITCPYERKTVACIWWLQQQDIPPQLAALASDSCWPAVTTNCKETLVIRVLACMACMYVSCRSL